MAAHSNEEVNATLFTTNGGLNELHISVDDGHPILTSLKALNIETDQFDSISTNPTELIGNEDTSSTWKCLSVSEVFNRESMMLDCMALIGGPTDAMEKKGKRKVTSKRGFQYTVFSVDVSIPRLQIAGSFATTSTVLTGGAMVLDGPRIVLCSLSSEIKSGLVSEELQLCFYTKISDGSEWELEGNIFLDAPARHAQKGPGLRESLPSVCIHILPPLLSDDLEYKEGILFTRKELWKVALVDNCTCSDRHISHYHVTWMLHDISEISATCVHLCPSTLTGPCNEGHGYFVGTDRSTLVEVSQSGDMLAEYHLPAQPSAISAAPTHWGEDGDSHAVVVSLATAKGIVHVYAHNDDGLTLVAVHKGVGGEGVFFEDFLGTGACQVLLLAGQKQEKKQIGKACLFTKAESKSSKKKKEKKRKKEGKASTVFKVIHSPLLQQSNAVDPNDIQPLSTKKKRKKHRSEANLSDIGSGFKARSKQISSALERRAKEEEIVCSHFANKLESLQQLVYAARRLLINSVPTSVGADSVHSAKCSNQIAIWKGKYLKPLFSSTSSYEAPAEEERPGTNFHGNASILKISSIHYSIEQDSGLLLISILVENIHHSKLLEQVFATLVHKNEGEIKIQSCVILSLKPRTPKRLVLSLNIARSNIVSPTHLFTMALVCFWKEGQQSKNAFHQTFCDFYGFLQIPKGLSNQTKRLLLPHAPGMLYCPSPYSFVLYKTPVSINIKQHHNNVKRRRGKVCLESFLNCLLRQRNYLHHGISIQAHVESMVSLELYSRTRSGVWFLLHDFLKTLPDHVVPCVDITVHDIMQIGSKLLSMKRTINFTLKYMLLLIKENRAKGGGKLAASSNRKSLDNCTSIKEIIHSAVEIVEHECKDIEKKK